MVQLIQLSELQSMLDALKRALYSGTRRVQFADRMVEYGSVDDMRKAIADLEEDIAETGGPNPPTFTLASHSRD